MEAHTISDKGLVWEMSLVCLQSACQQEYTALWRIQPITVDNPQAAVCPNSRHIDFFTFFWTNNRCMNRDLDIKFFAKDTEDGSQIIHCRITFRR